MRRGVFLLALPALLVALGVRAADSPPGVALRVQSSLTRATVGDRLQVRVEVIHPPGVVFGEPVPVPGEGDSLILEPVKAPPSKQQEKSEVFYFQAQAFETGTVKIPAFRLDWKRTGGDAGTATSEPIPVEIVSVLKGPQDQPADLKPPVELAPPPFPWLWMAASGALVLAVAAGLYLWHRRKRPTAERPPVPAVPALPPHELAFLELERLLASSLLREGKIKEFHVELAEILKRYLAGRFEIETLERTSEEVLRDLKRGRVGSEPMAVAREFFVATDLVKFAKDRPGEDEIRRSVDRAYRLVDLTKLVPGPPRVEAGATSSPVSVESAG